MEQLLHSRVIGQDEAVVAVAKAVRRARAGLKDPKRQLAPLCSWGQQGGKTELAKSTSRIYVR